MSDDDRTAGSREEGPDDGTDGDGVEWESVEPADDSPDGDARTDDEPDAEAEAGSEVAAGTGTDAETETDPDPGADSEAGDEPESDPATGAEPGSGTDAGAGDDPGPATDAPADARARAEPPEDALLDVQDLDAGYGDLQILTGVDMQVGPEEYVTIVGPNGAGKSTVMKSVFGLTTHMGGTVTFDGEDITGKDPEEIIHHGLGYVPQNENVFAGLTVIENLEMGAYILDEVPEDRLRAVFDRFPILEERKDQRAGTLSGGQQQMLAMGRALMLDPELLLLDEPSAGLAPDLVEDMFDRIDAINDAGTAVLMVEQNAKEALRRCDRGYVLVQGENRFMDRGEALLADREVRQQFLGG